MGIADDFALLEMQQEFIERFYAKGNGLKQSLPMLSSSCPGTKKEEIFLYIQNEKILYFYTYSII